MLLFVKVRAGRWPEMARLGIIDFVSSWIQSTAERSSRCARVREITYDSLAIFLVSNGYGDADGELGVDAGDAGLRWKGAERSSINFWNS
jgi:hypothetical protein